MIRVAELRDLPILTSIETAGFGADAWTAAQLAEEIAGDRVVVVLEDDETVRGFASIRLSPPEAELLRIGVSPVARRSGLGSRLLTAAEEAARSHGVDRMLLEVGSDNDAALGLYRRTGYRETGRRRGYYRSGTDAVLMDRDLT